MVSNISFEWRYNYVIKATFSIDSEDLTVAHLMQFIMFYNKMMLMIFEEVMLDSTGLLKVDADFFKFLLKFMSKILFKLSLIKSNCVFIMIFIYFQRIYSETQCNCTFLQCVNDIIFVKADLADCDNTQFWVDRVWSFWFFIWFEFRNFCQGFRCVFIGQNFFEKSSKNIFFSNFWKIALWKFLLQNYLKIMEFPLWIRTK